MKNKFFHKILSFWLFIGIGIFAQAILADFAVREDKYSLENYGDVKEPCYERAVIGGPPFIDEYVFPLREDRRFYGRASLNSGIYVLSSFKNKSTDVPDVRGTFLRKSITKTNPGVEFAFGYIWSPRVHGEIEYLLIRNLNYSPNPVFSNVSTQRSLTATLTNNTLLANIYYDFGYYARFRPFITVGVGYSYNSAISAISPVPANTIVIAGPKKMSSVALMGGLGFRVHMFTRWFANVSYRYVNLGLVRFQPTMNVTVDANYSVSLFSLGLIYLF